jgi:putative two-component system response regulator
LAPFVDEICGEAVGPTAMNEETLYKAKILVVDDQEQTVKLLERILNDGGYGNVTTTTESADVVGICARTPPDLILLDLLMPAPDGFEVMEMLKPWTEGRWFPILVLSADMTSDARKRALSVGARDFLTKPLDGTEVLLRIRNLLEARFLQRELRGESLSLEQKVDERTRELNLARLEILERLAIASEYRDDDSGEHSQRIGRTSALVAEALGLPDDEAKLIRLAAPLHDIGKIGVPDQTLLKPGKLTPEEFSVMKNHVNIGAFILSRSRSRILQIGERIALTHHEWWNGKGYAAGLKGDEIPIEGRIVAVADVFDALVNDRPYKSAWPIPQAVAEIVRGSGTQFDPGVVEAFETLDHELLVAPVEAPIQILPRDTGPAGPGPTENSLHYAPLVQ